MGDWSGVEGIPLRTGHAAKSDELSENFPIDPTLPSFSENYIAHFFRKMSEKRPFLKVHNLQNFYENSYDLVA